VDKINLSTERTLETVHRGHAYRLIVKPTATQGPTLMPTVDLPVAEVPARLVGAPSPLPEAAEFLRVSLRHLAKLAAEEKIRTITIGRRRLVPWAELQRVATEGVN
jgi:excisionase family DNA binding protein